MFEEVNLHCADLLLKSKNYFDKSTGENLKRIKQFGAPGLDVKKTKANPS